MTISSSRVNDAAAWERTPLSTAELSLAETADRGPGEDWADWADVPR